MQLFFCEKYNFWYRRNDWPGILPEEKKKTDARGRPLVWSNRISSADQKSTRVPMETVCLAPTASESISWPMYLTQTRVRLLKLYW